MERDFAHVFICLRPHTLLGFCLRWCVSFVGYESGQIQRAEYGLQRNSIPLATHFFLLWEGGEVGEVNQREG